MESTLSANKNLSFYQSSRVVIGFDQTGHLQSKQRASRFLASFSNAHLTVFQRVRGVETFLILLPLKQTHIGRTLGKELERRRIDRAMTSMPIRR